ncbi:unnamed protein product [Ilex paraguariensis]|uniref:Uncharacterized protein n=1 Tax=Ilex paraguariensis TaxID=185542 RepID=A0ABC8TYE4_9AQUA
MEEADEIALNSLRRKDNKVDRIHVSIVWLHRTNYNFRFSKNKRAIMAAEARRLNLKKQIVDEVPLVQFVDRLAIRRRSPPRHTHPPPFDRYLHLFWDGKVLANLSYT